MTTGFAAVPRWILDHGLSAHALAVYVVLSAHAAKDGTCWPSQGRIAEMTSTSRNTVRKALDELREVGAVEWIGQTGEDGSQRSNLYRLTIFTQPVENPTPPTHHTNTPAQDVNNPCSPREQPLFTTCARTITNEQEPMNNTLPQNPNLSTDHLSTGNDFDAFYNHYPRHAEKPAALAAFNEAVASGVDPQVIIDGAAAYANDPNLPAYRWIPYPEKWLRNRGWEDPPQPFRAEEHYSKMDRLNARIDLSFDALRQLNETVKETLGAKPVRRAYVSTNPF
ncbi:helix-turn-helix domain-containing protein [Trueperella pyogenes]|uniref:helix-turn-helix domain-containing protein n=1 Tax=Trueperella pyogenes TaxID=1661 RepID=UPI00345D7A55